MCSRVSDTLFAHFSANVIMIILSIGSQHHVHMCRDYYTFWLPLLKSPLKWLCYQTQMKKTHPFPSLLMLVSGKLLRKERKVTQG